MSKQPPKPTGDDYRAVLEAMSEQIERVEYPDHSDDDTRALQTILHQYANGTLARTVIVLTGEAQRLARARHDVPGEPAPLPTAEDYEAVLEAIDEQIERVPAVVGKPEDYEDDLPVADALWDFAWRAMSELILGIKDKAQRLATKRNTPNGG